jgi:hypothetical protein
MSICGTIEEKMIYGTKHVQILEAVTPYAKPHALSYGTASTMSSSTQGQAPSSDFKSIFDEALRNYEAKTGKSLLDDPLATELKRGESVDAIKAILRGQAEAFQQFRDGDQRLMKEISPVVDVLNTFSNSLGWVAGIVRQ